MGSARGPSERADLTEGAGAQPRRALVGVPRASARTHRVPLHDVVGLRRGVDPRRRIFLQPLEVAHEASPRWSRHAAHVPTGARLAASDVECKRSMRTSEQRCGQGRCFHLPPRGSSGCRCWRWHPAAARLQRTCARAERGARVVFAARSAAPLSAAVGPPKSRTSNARRPTPRLEPSSHLSPPTSRAWCPLPCRRRVLARSAAGRAAVARARRGGAGAGEREGEVTRRDRRLAAPPSPCAPACGELDGKVCVCWGWGAWAEGEVCVCVGGSATGEQCGACARALLPDLRPARARARLHPGPCRSRPINPNPIQCRSPSSK